MASVYSILAQGQLSNSVGTIATVPGGKSWVVSKIVVVNNDSVARTFGLYADGTTASKVLIPPTVSIPTGGFAVWGGGETLAAGDTIAGIASAATQLTYTIFGDEIT